MRPKLEEIPKLSDGEEERAISLHRKAIFINASDSSVVPLDEFFQLLKQGMVTAINYTLDRTLGELTLRDILINISCLYDTCDEYCDMYRMGLSVKDIKKAKEEGKVALIPGIQNPQCIEVGEFKTTEGLRLLRILHRVGVRILELTYEHKNSIGDGGSEKTDCGLSKYGIRVVEEMNKLGMVIDLAHVGHATSMETIELSKDPVIISHSCTRAISHHPRCKTDEAIKAMAEKGGVIGIVAKTHYLKPQLKAKYDRGSIWVDYMNHVNHVVDLVGVDHVGIGLDITYPLERPREEFARFLSTFPLFKPYDADMGYRKLQVEGLDSIPTYPNITRALVAQEYSDEEIFKILGKNFLRVFEKVWKK